MVCFATIVTDDLEVWTFLTKVASALGTVRRACSYNDMDTKHRDSVWLSSGV